MVLEYLTEKLSDEQKELIHFHTPVAQAMFRALDNALINNDNGIGLPHYASINPLIVRDITFYLDKLNIAKTRITRKFARLEINTEFINTPSFQQWRMDSKFNASVMRADRREHASDLVKANGAHIRTGLNRIGFAKVAKNEFTYDTAMLATYRQGIEANLVKSIEVGIANGKIKDKFYSDSANYKKLVSEVLDYYLINNGTYNLEANISDQRGRSIFKALKRIGNPISSKDFRALLVVPADQAFVLTPANQSAINDIFYFIAELSGSKALTETKKIHAGYKAYRTRKLPHLDMDTDEGRKELHEYIWLVRIYNKLDQFYANGSVLWDIPVEIDASMSIAQIVGALTNDARLLESTNVIGTELSDPWYIEGVRRLSAKAVGTPVFYGSSRSAIALIRSKRIDVDKEEVNRIRREFASGRFAVMKQFKDALIRNYSVEQPIIPIKIWNDSFDVHVNKFKSAGSRVVVTEGFDHSARTFKYSFTHEPILVPDYKYMKLFWATCLVHNLDSQIMNRIASNTDKWLLTIHDAIISLPSHAGLFRKQYASLLKEINTNRYSILQEYRKSIGATSMKSDVAFHKLFKSVVPADDTEFLPTAMK